MTEEAVETAEAVEEESIAADALETTEDYSEVNILDMTDEEFSRVLSEGIPTINPEQSEAEDTSEAVAAEVDEGIEENEDEGEEDVQQDYEEESEGLQAEEEVGEEVTEEEVTETVDLTPEDIVKELFSPFKANGKDIQVDNVQDARQLMQMGANYNKKMAALKPNLKMLKMLENNGLLDENKLSYLIDLDKKNPDAIKKLIKDSSIDIDELDNTENLNYKPSTYTVNDKEVELDETLNDIRETPSYGKTLDIISNKFDETSKQMLLENPAAIRVLNDHIGSGIYDKIMGIVDTERMFNRIPAGMSDIEAYKFVGDKINAQGGFQAQPNGTSVTKTVRSKNTKSAVDQKLSGKKRAASSTKGKPSPKNNLDGFNPLAMSDEEFEKIGIQKFLT